ncbi:putative integrase/recombinase [Planomonospora sphaerica]|uniref:Putative integrase/recombinase n=1 Tax=Planomonospora sphaerica TaxID=161355 RepID=A0A171DQV0_9ACTN|nr:tyrosine-type recombinase/integrase [Planomonospora sphaerica]GAT71434.1 putative integrase/recombinase [Planomonospora sphaerica]
MTVLQSIPADPPAAPAAQTATVHTAADHGLSPAARAALEAGVPASTRRAYAADWRSFTAWCSQAGRMALPATSQTVTEYAAHLMSAPSTRTGRPLSPSSIERALTAIRSMHKAAGLTAPETSGARKVLAGRREQLALAHDPAAKVRKATPVLPTEIRAMLATVDRTTLAGMRDAVLVLLGYATAARSSELAALNLGDVAETPDGLVVSVYRRKIKRHTETAVPYGSNPATCPVRAARALLAALADLGRTRGPLLVRIDRHGRVAPPLTRRGKTIGDPDGRMTPEAIADVVARLAAAAGLPGDWSGHSLRRGFATAARRQGHALERIGRHGGWADGSRALLGYLEDADAWTDNPVVGL